MFHYWPVCVNGSPNQSVWEPYEFQMKGVRKKGKRARPCPGMWDIRGCACVCVCALKAPVCAVFACLGLYTHSHTHNHSCPSHYTAISDLLSQPETWRADGSTVHFLLWSLGKIANLFCGIFECTAQ